MKLQPLASCMLLGLLATSATASGPALEGVRARTAGEEIVYFLLPDRFENADASNDRGGLIGDRHVTGFDPTSKAFYLGGDIEGIERRLDYIQGLGATAVWLAPVFRNKPVQGPKGGESAGYHGYWVTDFTRVDPHFGTNGQLLALVQAAHSRGLKVYLDIITNHTADVIRYRECPDGPCPYRSRADHPGSPAYTPYIPPGEEHVKVPAWLNEPAYYHNRGETTFEGESSTMGDFVGLDDLATEDPRVVQGFIDIFGRWIDEFGIDGFRVDTARHVNPEFWQAFVPAMRERAAARGIPNFTIFGEVFTEDVDVTNQAWHTRVAGFPSVLDFAFANAVRAVVADGAGTDQLARLFHGDALYEGGEATAIALPTFISNHDMGRFAWFVREARPRASDAEVLARVKLAHAMLFLLRGVPVVYYGDEQGFAGLGNDQDARQPLFASAVKRYNRTPLVGTRASTTQANFDVTHPLYLEIQSLARLRAGHPAIARGRQVVRQYGEGPGLFAVSRFDPDSGEEIVVAFNTAGVPWSGRVEVDEASRRFRPLHGECAAQTAEPRSLALAIPAFGYVVCAAEARP